MIGALRYANWRYDGFDTIVIATDPEYVVEGATQWLGIWARSNWRTSVGTTVRNKDLWQMFCGEINRWGEDDVLVKFWKIPSEQNIKTFQEALRQAHESYVPLEFYDFMALRP